MHAVAGTVAVAVAIGLAIGLLSLATSIGLYGSEYKADPLAIAGAAVVYNMQLIGMLALGRPAVYRTVDHAACYARAVSARQRDRNAAGRSACAAVLGDAATRAICS